MLTIETPKPTNGLLDRLGTAYRRKFVDACDEVTLEFEQIIAKPGDEMSYVYFPVSGYLSQITMWSRPGLEVAMTGHEGMLGLPIVLDVPTSPVLVLVQGAGDALRMGSARFRKELAGNNGLRLQINRFNSVSITQLALTAQCAKFHSVEERMARWLLMTSDRARSSAFHITHAYLAYMLGSRRVGVTIAASRLRAEGIIRYRRGWLEIKDLERLRAASCDCYRDGNSAYDSVYAPKPVAA